MSSQGRIAANKRNAVRSTGPRTADGKTRASRNARKHGLSVSIRHEPGISIKIEALAVAIAGKDAKERHLQAARLAAEAELELRRLDEFRVALVQAELDNTQSVTKAADGRSHQGHISEPTLQKNAWAYVRALPVLAKLDRYERRALSQHRHAFHNYTIALEESNASRPNIRRESIF